MSGTLYSIPFLISSIVIALWLWVRVGQGIRGSIIDHYGSKLLLKTSLANSVGCACLLFAYGLLSLWRAFDPNHAAGIQILSATIAWYLPARVLWSLIHADSRLIRLYDLKPWPSLVPRSHMEYLAHLVGVKMPVLMVSTRLNSPITFGKRSQKATIAIPARWVNDSTARQDSVLLHELAHLKNCDVGITTWGHAFSRKPWLVISLCTALVVLGYWDSGPGWTMDVQAATLYGACILHVAMLSVIVRRDRERLADRTVALLLRDPALADQALRHALTWEREPKPGERRESALSRLMRWLGEKAVVGRYPRIWRIALAGISLLHSSHPPAMERTTRAVQEANRASSLRNLPLFSHSFWAGSLCGLMGTLLGISGLTFNRHVLGITDPDRVLGTTAGLIVGAALPMGAFFSLLFALPAWATARPVRFENRYVGALLLRYTIGFLAAAGTSMMLLLPWGRFELTVQAIFVCMWSFMALSTAFLLTLTLVAMWLLTLYWQRWTMVDMIWAVFCLGPGLLISILLLGIGLAWTLPEQPVRSALLAAGFLAGLVGFMLLFGRSSFSGRDSYLIYRIAGYSKLRHEGTEFLWPGLFTASGCAVTTICGVGAAVFIGLESLFGSSHMDSTLLVLFLLLLACSTLVALSRTRAPWSVSQLVHSQATFQRLWATLESGRRPATSVVPARTPANNYNGSLTTEMLLDWADILAEHPVCPAWMNKATKWLSSCETTGGFGLWPGCSPRLCSTYHALELLQRAGQQPHNPAEGHARWIHELQCADGSFKGPFSRRLPVEDTFFAVKSLMLLGHPLNGTSRQHCTAFLRSTASAARTSSGSVMAVFYAFETLRLLDALAPADDSQFQEWAIGVIPTFATAGVGYAAEPLLCAIRVLRGCQRTDPGERLSNDLLWGIADRAAHALSTNGKSLVPPWVNECLVSRRHIDSSPPFSKTA